jgi:hypothetical protein
VDGRAVHNGMSVFVFLAEEFSELEQGVDALGGLHVVGFSFLVFSGFFSCPIPHE